MKKAFHNERGMAMVTTLLLTLLLSLLVAAMLFSSTADVLISGNDVRTNQAFYIAEAGIHRASGWFSSKFGVDPNSGLYMLPEQNPSNTVGVAGKLNYTDTPYYKRGATASSAEQELPTSVKVLSGGALQNVVLAGDGTNTFPASYRVAANDNSGVAKTFTYDDVVSDFTSHLVNQAEGEGRFSVKATLVSIVPPTGGQQGNVTWLLESSGKITRGDGTAIASATLWAYISARVTAIQKTVIAQVGSQQVSLGAGVIAKGGITWTSNAVIVDSYKSSKGAYNINLAANSFPGQIGTKNKGSRGDLRTNNEPDTSGINIKNGTVTGTVNARLPMPDVDGGFDPIVFDHTDNGRGGPLVKTVDSYNQGPLVFPPVPDPPAPPAGAVNYSYGSKGTATLPSNPKGYNTIDVSKGTLTIPPGNYGTINVDTQGTIVLGVPGQSTVYNLQNFSGGAQGNIIFKGPVTINVKNSLDAGAGMSVADPSIPAKNIQWNFVGGSNQTVYLGGHAMTLGVFYAPNNTLYMRGGTDFYGAIVAKSVDIGGNAGIHVDEDAVSGVSTTVAITAPTTSIVGYTASSYSLWRIMQEIN